SRTLWVSSNKGLFSLIFRKENGGLSIEKLRLFTHSNGLQSNEFNKGAYHKSGKTLYFGGINGLNYFRPEEMLDWKNGIKIVISDALVNNIPVNTGVSTPYLYKLKLPFKH